MKRILIVIDMQNDFVTGALGSAAAAGIAGGIRGRVEDCLGCGGSVLFTMDTHLDGDYEGGGRTREAALIPRHCIRGTAGWEIVPELAGYAGGNTVEKPAFLSPALAGEIERRFGRDVQLTLCGVCTDICVVSNALALRAAFPDAAIRVEAGLCAGTSPENHAAALAVMKSCLIEVV